jgi:hypothetical protein
MTALIRYYVTTMLLSQRYLAPVLLFIGLLAVLTSSDSGPLTATYGASAGAMLVCATWLTAALAGLEDRTHRSVVTVNAGGHLRTLLALTATALLWCLFLTVAGLALPLFLGAHSVTVSDLALGTEAQLTCALTGIAIGLPCSRLLFRHQGAALLLSLALLLTALLARHVSPVNALLTSLQNTPGSAGLLGSTAQLLIVSAVVLAAGVALTQGIAVRRD